MNSMTLRTSCLSALLAACVVGQVSGQTLADYQTEISSQNPSDYFTLDSTYDSAVNPSVDLSWFGEGGFTYDVYGNPSNSYFYVNNTDDLWNFSDPLINGGGSANSNATAKGSITLLFRSLSGPNASGQRFIFDATTTAGIGTSNHNALSLFVENGAPTSEDTNSLKLRFGDTTTTILQRSNMLYSTWYYFALTYDEARVPNKAVWYLGPAGGQLISGMTTNEADAVAGDGNGLHIGQRADYAGAFRSPGNGRVDEFAIWARELSSTEVSNQFAKLPALSSGVTVTNLIVDDSFADGDRAATGPLQADWWSSTSTSGNSVEAYTNQLGLVSGTSGRGLHGTFAPQDLEIGDTIRVTYTFTTPVTVGTEKSTAFKVALMDFNDAGLAADLLSSSSSPQPLYFNFPGYMADMDVNYTGANTGIREHLTNDTGRFTSTTAEWNALGNSSATDYSFAPETEYVGVLSVTRTDYDSVDVFSSISQGGVLMDSDVESDSAEIANHFGVLGFAATSGTFGSSNVAGETEDNGITFSNIKVELITLATEAPALSLIASGGNAILSWPSSFTGYGLESTTTLNPASWSGAGTPTVVGDRYYVTNSLSGDANYYRLSKP